MKKKLVLYTLCTFLTVSLFAQIEFGTASFYGKEFNGRKTANGEIYSENKLTAAHRTLPFGTIIKVTNAQNNKSVYLKVNDRGPFHKNRVLDVSTKAATLLDFKHKGTAYVKIEVVDTDQIPADDAEIADIVAKDNGIQTYDTTADGNATETPPIKQEKAENKPAGNSNPAPFTAIFDPVKEGITNRSPYFVITKIDKSKSGFYGLQLGVFSDMTAIMHLVEELEAKYNQSMVVQQAEINGKKVYKLYIGKFQNRAYADALKSVLSDKYKDAFVVQYE